jgi:filamentous hemagglutinin family protein
MNTIQKSQQMFPELFTSARSANKPSERRRKLVFGTPRKPGNAMIFMVSFMTYLLGIFPSLLYALPTDPTVQAGDVTIDASVPDALTILQSTDKAIIDWQGFSIDANERVDFKLPSANGVTLNRVTGNDPSAIFGKLTSNGNLFLINPNGILFGAGSQVDVHGLLATTSDIRNEDFMSGNYNFNIPSTRGGTIVNRGTITAREGGFVHLVAPGVVNDGVINARLGQVTLASGNTFTLDLYGDQMINFGLGSQIVEEVIGLDGKALKSLVSNKGKIFADGGRVLLGVNAAQGVVDQVINMAGIIQAQTAENINGTIVLSGGDSGQVEVTGTLDASGYGTGETGGTIHVFGDDIALKDFAILNASGDAGGGEILVGGDYQGLGSYQTASRVYVGRDVSIFNDAIVTGHGGRSIFWADRRMRFFGSVYARGGREWGDGGFVEVSGKEELYFDGSVDTTAANGKRGKLLLDPDDIVIANGAGATSGAVTQTIFEETLEVNLGTTNIELIATDSITLNDLSDNLLNINISGSASLVMTAGAGGITFLDTNDKIKATGNITMTATGGDLTLGSLESVTGDITLQGKNLALAGSYNSANGTANLTATQGIAVNSNFSSASNANLNADTITLASGISVTSGGTLALNSTSGTNAQGAVTVNSASGLTLSDNFTSTGAATFNADSNNDGTGTFTVASGKTVTTGNNALSVTGANIALVGTLNSGTGTTTLLASNGGAIGLGAGAGAFSLSGAELQNISAGNLVVGNSTTGDITVDGVTAANSNNITGTTTLNATGSGKAVTFSGTASTFNALTVNGGSSVAVNTAVTTDAGNLTLDGGTGSVTGSGTTNLTASQGIILNSNFNSTGDSNLLADTITLASGITVASGGTLVLNSTSGTNAEGAVTVNSANGLTINDNVTSAGTATFNADSDNDGTGTFTIASGKTVTSGDNTLSVTGADIALVGNLDSGTGQTTLLASNGGAIGLGAGAGAFSLSGAELEKISAGNLSIGDSTTGNITVDGVTAANSDNITGTTTLNATGSGKTVTFSGTASTFNALTANAENGITVSGDLTTEGAAIFDADSDNDGTGTFTVATGKTVATGNNALSVTGTDIALTGNLNSGTGTTTLLASNGGTIGLGVGAGTFLLSGAELQNISAGNLSIGDSTTGNITVDGVTAANSDNITGTTTLNATGSGKTVTFSGTASTFNALTANAQSGVAVNTALTTDAGNLTVNSGTTVSDAGGGQLTVTGASSFTGTTGVSLTNTANSFTGAVSLNSSGGNATIATNNALTLGASTIGGNLIATVAGGNGLIVSGNQTVTGTIAVTTADDITLTAGLFSSSASASAISLTSTTGGIFDGDTTDALDISAPTGGLTVNSVTGFGTLTNPIETKLASVNINNTGTGNVNIFETDGLDIVNINHTGTGDIKVSYSGALTGETNAIAAGGTETFFNRDSRGQILPGLGVTLSEASTAKTVNTVTNIEGNYFANKLPSNSSSKTVTGILSGSSSGPFLTNVFNEKFELVQIARKTRKAHKGLKGFARFWKPSGNKNTEMVNRPAKRSVREEAKLRKKTLEKRKRLERKRRARIKNARIKRLGETAALEKPRRKKQPDTWLSQTLKTFFKN